MQCTVDLLKLPDASIQSSCTVRETCRWRHYKCVLYTVTTATGTQDWDKYVGRQTMQTLVRQRQRHETQLKVTTDLLYKTANVVSQI